MLVRSVMWCACLMACVTSSFMLCISYQWKGPCVCARIFEVGRQKRKNCEQLTSNILITSNREAHISVLQRSDWPVCPWKRILFITLCHVFSLSFIYFFFYHIYPEFSSSQMDSSPAHTLPVFTVLCISVFVNISDTAPDTSHTSPSIPHFLFFFSTQSTSSFVPGTNLHKNEQINEMSQRHFSLKINTKKMW